MHRPFWLQMALAAALACCGLAAHAEAQDAGDSPTYVQAVREAIEEYQAGNFREARALFEEAHRIFPNARTLRGLGMMAFELHDYGSSVRQLQAALSSKEKPLDGHLRTETEQLLRRAERFVGRLTLALVPSHAVVLVDGLETERHPGQPLMLTLGEHKLEFRAQGHVPETRMISVRGGEADHWTVSLSPGSALSPTAAAQSLTRPTDTSTRPPVDAAPTRRPVYKSPWLWTGVGLAVAGGVAAGVIVGLKTRQEPDGWDRAWQ